MRSTTAWEATNKASLVALDVVTPGYVTLSGDQVPRPTHGRIKKFEAVLLSH